MAVLIDTGALYALADADSHMHGQVVDYVMQSDDLLLVPITTLPEADYLISSRLGAHAAIALMRSILAGEMRVENLTAPDLARSLELMEQYADSAIGFVDASVIALAERLRITRLLTLDQRHFRFVRPRHCPAFDIIP